MLKQGLQLAKRPSFELPRLPLRLVDMDDDAIMRLLVRFTRYQDHISSELVAAEIDERAADNLLEVAKARHLAKGWTGASTDRVAIAKAEALMDDNVQSHIKAYEEVYAKRKMLQILVESLARDGAVVSRELTRRVGNKTVERRADRYS